MLPPPAYYKFKQGKKQSFPNRIMKIDTSLMTLNHLLKFREDYSPLIINIETLNPNVQDELNQLCMVTYCYFKVDESIAKED